MSRLMALLEWRICSSIAPKPSENNLNSAWPKFCNVLMLVAQTGWARQPSIHVNARFFFMMQFLHGCWDNTGQVYLCIYGKPSMNFFIETFNAAKFGLYISRRMAPAFRLASVISPCKTLSE